MIATASPGSIVALIGIVIGGLSLAGAPAYLFEDVMGLESATAWGLGGLVWGVGTLLVHDSGLELTAAFVLYQATGIGVRHPLTFAAGGLTVLYLLTAYSERDEGDAVGTN